MDIRINYLDRNEFNYPPAPEIKEVLRNFDINKLCFYTRIFSEGKKSIFTEYLSEVYHIDENQILMGYGGEDILKQVVHFFLTEADNNKTMLIPNFSWWYYKSIADEVNGESILFPLFEEEDTFRYDMIALEKLAKQENPKIVLLASPNNPTGNMLTTDELEHILSFLSPQTVVLVDEAYASFVVTDNNYIKRLIDKYPNLIITRTLSKFYGLPGLRLGFGFMGKALERFTKYSTKYLGYNRLSEEIGITALKAEEYYRNIARLMNEDRLLYTKEIGCLPDFKVYKSNANFILIKYPIELKEQLQESLREQKLVVKFMDEPGLHTHMRITIGTHEQNYAVIESIKRTVNK